MKVQRVMLSLLAALLLPGLALAQDGDTQATFTVQKLFDDGNSVTPVTINIQCFTGLPQNQSQEVYPDNGGAFEVKFIVESFAQGELDCNIWEGDVSGYSASYDATSNYAVATEDAAGCHFTDVDTSNWVDEDPQNLCEIVNTPDAVEVTVSKTWVIDGMGGDSLDSSYRLTLACDDEIVGGIFDIGANTWTKVLYNGDGNGTADVDYSADVVPYWDGGTDCWVMETVFDSSVEVASNCGTGANPGMNVELAGGASCEVTNTVFYEGIPTLSQYGMAILAMLMLGVGFVGFRRFV
ncbi:MAG TPA: IPTL-CTERM sorting domain-containing protein [Xanthomonadales bacterium]|nr:IPTL-CTERM sorting domain-containing protein [Xanthomonadales bacterium]